MSQADNPTTPDVDDLRNVLEPYTDDFAEAADAADDRAQADAYAALAALARGERVPRHIARRIVDRAARGGR